MDILKKEELTEEQKEVLIKEKLLNELLGELLQAKRELIMATQGFNYADSDEMIDMYAYQIIAAQRKCDLLYKKARDNGMKYNDIIANNIMTVDM